SCLPIVPYGAVAAAREDLQSAIRISSNVQQVDPAAQRVPAAPAVAGSRLPVMPESAVAAAREDLQSAVRVLGYGQQIDTFCERPGGRNLGWNWAAEKMSVNPRGESGRACRCARQAVAGADGQALPRRRSQILAGRSRLRICVGWCLGSPAVAATQTHRHSS